MDFLIRLLAAASIWLCLLSTDHLVNGRNLTNSLNMAGQNASTFYGDKWAHSLLQTTGTATNKDYINHWAVLRTSEGAFYGIKASLSTHDLPTVKQDQSSAMEIWFVNEGDGSDEDYNAIQVGWQVYPGLYGDHKSHFFIQWTVDRNYVSGCYDLLCEGFVLDKTSTNTLVPGDFFEPVSQYNGQQWYIDIRISKDPVTGDWWVHHGADGAELAVGYFPKSLFTSLAQHASHVTIGGVVAFAKGDSSPPMGSGHFAAEGKGKAASIFNPRARIREKTTYQLLPHYDAGNCYTARTTSERIYYIGGPGGCTN